MTISPTHGNIPILLIPGYWLGSWAWDDVTRKLGAKGLQAQGVTLPGLASQHTPRELIRFADHVTYVTELLRNSSTQAIVVAHSGAGAIASAVADTMPEALRRIIYVDSGPVSNRTIPRPDLSLTDVELPFPGFETLTTMGASSRGLSLEDKQHIAKRAVPHPVGAICEAIELRNPQRNSVPATMICCSASSQTVRSLSTEGNPMFAPINDLSDVTFVDLPTGHWPMFSESDALAELIARAVEGD